MNGNATHFAQTIRRHESKQGAEALVKEDNGQAKSHNYQRLVKAEIAWIDTPTVLCMLVGCLCSFGQTGTQAYQTSAFTKILPGVACQACGNILDGVCQRLLHTTPTNKTVLQGNTISENGMYNYFDLAMLCTEIIYSNEQVTHVFAPPDMTSKGGMTNHSHKTKRDSGERDPSQTSNYVPLHKKTDQGTTTTSARVHPWQPLFVAKQGSTTTKTGTVTKDVDDQRSGSPNLLGGKQV